MLFCLLFFSLDSQPIYSLCLQNRHFEYSAENLFTTSVSCFQVKWIPKRASEEKARYEGLMLVAVFCNCCISIGLSSIQMDIDLRTAIFLFALEMSTKICYFHCYIKLVLPDKSIQFSFPSSVPSSSIL